MTVLHQDVAGVTADEVSPSSDQHLGHGINEQVSVGFSLPYSTKELDTAWDPEAVVNVTVQISSLFRNSFVLQSPGLLDRRVCVPVFTMNMPLKKMFSFFVLCKVFGLSSCGRIIERWLRG